MFIKLDGTYSERNDDSQLYDYIDEIIQIRIYDNTFVNNSASYVNDTYFELYFLNLNQSIGHKYQSYDVTSNGYNLWEFFQYKYKTNIGIINQNKGLGLSTTSGHIGSMLYQSGISVGTTAVAIQNLEMLDGVLGVF